jgi:ATP-dependent protease ClpP protease subunit
MAKQILLYGEIFSFSSEMFLTEMEALKDDDIVLRINTIGGDPESTFGMISKFQEHEGLKTIKVDGRAFSMGAFFLCYVDFAEALDVSSFILHRARFPEWMEASETFFDEATRARLDNVNKALRKALEAKIDVTKFEKISGVTIDQLFSMDGRIDVTLNAKQAKQIKLINKINPITPEIQASIQSNSGEMMQMAAKFVDTTEAKEEVVEEIKILNKDTNMDLAKLKTDHPALYAQVMQAGMEAGVSQEKDRAGAWMAFADIDIKAVTEGVKSDKALSATDMAELTRKGISAKLIGNAEEEAPGDVVVPPTKDKVVPEAQVKVNEFEAAVNKKLGLKTEQT